MAGWYRRELADDARVVMLLELGQIELVKAHFRTVEARVRNECDETPEGCEDWETKLRALDLWRPIDELITVQLANRARVRRAEEKRAAEAAASRLLTLANANSRLLMPTQHNTTHDQVILDPGSGESEGSGGKAPRKPRGPSKGKLALEAWRDAVRLVTGVPSAESGKALETIAATLQATIAESGDTFEAVVRRRSEFGKSLQLRWAAQDYASDRSRAGGPVRVVKPGWNDETHMLGVPKGKVNL